mmetsp:Transcript_11313/g.20783  ORF Transcript_11313/g.20783 Transcript_11313/m.20783 type:complete len:564 (+) Transcript_11313:182-1873(+)
MMGPDKKHHSGGRWRRRTTALFLLCYLLLLSCETAQSRDADDRSRLLYADDPGATIILEYQLHNAPSKDYSGDEQKKAAKNQPGSEYDEERHIKPYFLMPDNGPRVVQYYSPWSGHCQFFKSKYIDLAKEMNLRLPDEQPEVNFHAVSCSVYHWICMQNNVKEFPTIVAFTADSVVPQLLNEKKLTAESIAKTVGVQLNAPVVMEHYAESEVEGNDAFRAVDILGASLNGLIRTRDAVYKDAALSFTHALQTGIFTKQIYGQAAPLDSAQREAFSDWIDLLYWALPPTWILHTLINDIRNNIDSVMFSEENLLFMVEKHQDVVNGGNVRWSEQCGKADDRAGYSCGLWSLLHIISIGVIERHRAVLGAQDEVSTKFVGQTMRNYIEHFFDCAQCQEYFVGMFDTCGFNHCRRFKQPQKKLPPPESWEEVALWLWEVHNDVNVKLVEAELKRKGSVHTLEHQLSLAAWPPAGECKTCRDVNGKWDKAAVLGHLKKEYWPGGVQNFRFVVLKKKDYSKDESPGILSGLLENLFFLGFSAAIVMWCTRKKYVSFTGRHKKRDHDYV